MSTGMGRGLLAALNRKKEIEKAAAEAEAAEERARLQIKEQQEAEEAANIQLKQRQEQEVKVSEVTVVDVKPIVVEKPTTLDPIRRGIGRGINLTALLAKKNTLIEPSICPTEQKPPLISEEPKLPSPVSPIATAKPFNKIFSMGRGLPLRKTSLTEHQKPPVTQSRQPNEIKVETLPNPVLKQPQEIKEEENPAHVSAIKPESKKSSLITSDNVTTSGNNTNSNFSVEKAIEELKIEHILRQSPVRKSGEAGQVTNLATNYVKLKCTKKGVYQYVVHFDPPVDNQFIRTKLLYHCSEVTGPVRLFDGHTLFLPICLKDPITLIKTKPKDSQNEITLRIQLTKILPPEQIPSAVFNIIFKNIMKILQMSRIGQHYFSSMRQIEIPKHHLQVWPGYTTAVHEFEDGLYLVIDVAHKVLRSETCWHMMTNLHRTANDLTKFRESVFNALIGNVVLTRYNNKTYRIDDIIWNENPMSEFVYHNGKPTTYYAYYKEHYNIEIKDLKQPLLLNRAKKSKQAQTACSTEAEKKETEIICLIPELCFMTGMSDELRNDFNVKKDLDSHTRLSPKQRCEQLMHLIQSIRENPEALKQIKNWGLELDDTMTRIQGRVLPREKILFAKREVETDEKCDWTRPAGNEEVIKAVDLKHWLVVYPAQKEQIVEKFCMLAMDCSRRIGIRLDMPKTVPLRDDRPDSYINEIKKNLNENVQMVVVIFNNISDSRYSRVKRLCCIECPVPSQVIVLKTINKPDNVLKTVAQKIILQMNVKLGGELWRLAIPIKKCMIIGIDVYHKTEKKYKSIVGFVSSLNHDQTRWYSKVCFQMVGQELTDTLKMAFMQSLKKYEETNGFLPEKIFIYRDGVSEGQLMVVSEHEVTQLRSCFANDYSPQICVIVVQKRINTRIFGIQGQAVNPPPGAILDHTITSKTSFDFYLVSQHVGQGTVTPTHYVIAYDDTLLKPDHIQRLSYKMTHLYYNWSGTIRVPAPCQYAHKLAFLTGQYLQENPSEQLCNRLFYL